MALLASLSRLTVKHPAAIVICFVVSLAPATWLAAGLGFRDNFADLLPDDAVAVADLERVRDAVGGTAFVVVAIDARDLEGAKAFARELGPALSALPNVLYTEGHLDLDFLRERRLYFLGTDKLAELTTTLRDRIDTIAARRTGLYVDLEDDDGDEGDSFASLEDADVTIDLPFRDDMVGDDGKYLYVLVRLAGDTSDLTFGREALAAIRGQVDELRARTPIDVRYTGSIVIRDEEHAILQGDVKIAGLVGFILCVLVVPLYTRRLRTMLLVSLPMVVSIAWFYAFARVVVGHLNIITGFLAAILFGLGVDFGTHLFLRYSEERARGASLEVATERSLTRTGRAVVGGALTTAAAFAVIHFAKFKGYSEFGLLAAVGVLLLLGISLCMVPAMNVVLERVAPMRIRPVARDPAAGITVPRWLRLAIVLAIPAIAALSAYAIATQRVRFHTNWRELKGESPASDFDDYMIDSLGGSFSLTLVHVPALADVDKVRDAIAEVRRERSARGLPSGITRTLAVTDLVPKDQSAKAMHIAALARQLARVRANQLAGNDRQRYDEALRLVRAEPFTIEDVPASLTQRFRTRSGQGTLVAIATSYRFYELDEVVAWADEMLAVRQAIKARGVDGAVMSENWVAGTVFRIILEDGPYIVVSAIIAIFVLLLLDFGSVRHASIALAPLILGMVSIAGAMWALGMQLNSINAVVIPSLVGMGVDSAIHVYHRYREDGPGSIPLVLRHSAGATLVAALTTVLGIGALLLAHHRGIRSIAELALVGTVSTYIATCVFFPLALETWERNVLRERPARQRSDSGWSFT